MKNRRELTERQAQILSFLRASMDQNGFAPTIQDVANRFGFLSPNAALLHLQALEKKGYIRRVRGISRGISIVGDTAHLPTVEALPAEPLKSDWQRAVEAFVYEQSTGNFYSRSLSKKTSMVTVGVINRMGYVDVNFNGDVVSGHRLAWLYMTGEWPRKSIDHINGERADNRFENLRDVSAMVNAQNIRAPRSTSSSGLLGAHKNNSPTRPWRSRITAGGVLIDLGEFKTAEEAHEAYMTAKRLFHVGCTI